MLKLSKSMTYGVLPDELEFFLATNQKDDDGFSVSKSGFSFSNCPRVGDIVLTEFELWKELQLACQEFHDGNDESGNWCSAVLGYLGFEWI